MKSKLTDDDIHATLVAKVAIKPSAPSKKGAPSVQLEKRTQSKRPKGSKSGITKKNIKSVSARSGTNTLEEAFLFFVDATKELEESQRQLSNEIYRLSEDLARTNADLKAQMAAKSRLAEELSTLISALPTGVVLLQEGKVYAFNAISQTYVPDISVDSNWVIPNHWAPAEPDHYRCELRTGSFRVLREEAFLLHPDRKMILIHDVTTTYQSQEERARQVKLASMGKMAAEIAHQLRTPLATAMIYAGHLSRQEVPDHRRLSFANLLNRQLSALENLVSRMMGFLQQRRHAPELIPIDNLLNECRDSILPLFEGKKVKLIVQSVGGEHLLNIQRDQFRGGLLSILENALSVSGPGQKVIIESIARGSRVNLRISDEGPGVAVELVDRLFEPFSTNRSGGTGLGLAIAKAAFESHGGQITFANLSPAGACFHVVLPVLEPF
jgi:two-component system sensor histidine kinase FlrB